MSGRGSGGGPGGGPGGGSGAGAGWRRRWPLRTRLALAVTAAVAFVALGVCTAAFLEGRSALYQQLDLSLTQAARLAAKQYGDSPPGTAAWDCRYLAAPACVQIVPVDPRKDPRGGENAYRMPVAPATRLVAARELAPFYTDIVVEGHPARMLTTDFLKDRALQVAVRSDSVETGIDRAARRLAVTAAGGVLLAALLGYWVARTGLAPVTRLTATAERIAATRDPRHRIELPPPGTAARTRSPGWPGASTPCSASWSSPSPRSGGSSRTPRTNCGPR